MYEDGDINNDEVYDNRIIFLTDAHPNHGRTDKTSLFGMVDTNANNKDNYIYTSFIGVGLDFNASLIQDITNTRGCNYYAVKSTDDFEQVMNADFNYMVSPLVFNVVLRLKSEGGGLCIEKVYGTSAASEEGMVKTGEITKINTLFPSKKSKVKGGTKGGIQLIKLKNNNENGKGFNVEIEVSFEDKYGREYKNNQFVTFETDEEDENDMIESNNYYDNTGIRKGILLCKYAELMMDWMQYEQDNGDNNNNTLRVNDKYKKLFKEFMVTPLVFNVCLKLNCEGTQCQIDKIYGSKDKLINKIMESGEIKKIHTLFPSKKSKKKGGTKGGIQLIKLKKIDNDGNDNNDKNINVEIEVSFEDRNGKKYKNTQFVTFEPPKLQKSLNNNDMIESDSDEENENNALLNFYDNIGIRKGILLCKYGEIMINWINDNNLNNQNEKMNNKHKKIFEQFTSYFKKEMVRCKDNDLQKEVDLMEKIIKW